MSDPIRAHSLVRALVVATLAVASLGGCQAPASVAETPPSATIGVASAGPTAQIVDGGTITLTDDDCTWDENPGSMPEGRLDIAIQNETDDFGVFQVHNLHTGRTFDEGRALIATIQEALKTGAEWPEAISDPIGEGTADAGSSSEFTVVPIAGTLGVVCSANTSPTGDILMVFLVGPLEVTRP